MFIPLKILVILSLACSVAFCEDLPTVHQIYETAQSGDLTKAHTMVDAVLKAHPQSAKAHFVDAEILVRQGDIAQAKSELAEAERLSPGLSFAKPQSVQNIKERIAGNDRNTMINTIASHTQQAKPKPFPWMMVIIVIGAVVLLVLIIKSMFSRQNSTAQSYSAAAGQGNSPGYPGSQSYSQQSGGGLGSSMMSGLATGVAAGAGIVAGEALMHHFMDGSEPANSVPSQSNPPQASDDSDFGVSDSSWDDNGMDDSSDNSW